MSDADLANQEKNHAALSSVLWALVLTVLKLVAGLATNSLGILSEALHSALDLVAAIITCFAVRVAARPADKTHHYGYGKVENLSALVETLLLLITCTWIVREAVDRLFFTTEVVHPSLWGIGVIVISLVVDINRSRMLRRVAKKHNSQALEADALHFTTDVWSSGVVLIGLVCVWVSSYLPEGHWLVPVLRMGDAVAALFVSGIVVVVGLRLSRKAVSALLDGTVSEHGEALEKALAQNLPGFAVRRVRLRESGADVFVDITVEAPAEMPLEAAHDITRQVELVVREVLTTADVVVHVEPASPEETSALATAHTLAAAHHLSIHNLSLSRLHSKDADNIDEVLVFVHVEAPPKMTIAEAHSRVDAFEQALAKRLGVARVVAHIEPEHRNEDTLETMSADESVRIMQLIDEVLPTLPEVSTVHDLTICRMGGQPFLSFHCIVPSNLTVAEAHALATRLEDALHHKDPALGHILIHTDPAGLEDVTLVR